MNKEQKLNETYKRFYEATINKPEFEKLQQKNDDLKMYHYFIQQLESLE